MHLIYRKEEVERTNGQIQMPEVESGRALWQNAIYFAAMVGILVFANWAKPTQQAGLWYSIYSAKWGITGLFGVLLVIVFVLWFKKSEFNPWLNSTWSFAKQILPLLFFGVLIAGFLLGRPGCTNRGLFTRQARARGSHSISLGKQSCRWKFD
jgi:hypothetical protein